MFFHIMVLLLKIAYRALISGERGQFGMRLGVIWRRGQGGQIGTRISGCPHGFYGFHGFCGIHAMVFMVSMVSSVSIVFRDPFGSQCR